MTSTSAFSRELERHPLSRELNWDPLQPLQTEEGRSRLADDYLTGRLGADRSIFWNGSAGASGLLLFGGGIAVSALLYVAGLGIAAAAVGGIALGWKLRSADHVPSEAESERRLHRALRKHFERAVFNAGEEWQRWSGQQKKQYLEQDLLLLVNDLKDAKRD